MDWVFSVALVLFAAIIYATLQLGVGTQLLLYHASKGKHIHKKTKGLIGSYISGVGMLVFLGLCATCFLLMSLFDGVLEGLYLIILITILTLLALLIWLFYYRWGKGTELWIPRIVAHFIDERAKVTESNTEAFMLGAMICFAELPVSFLLFVVAGNSIISLPIGYKLLAVAAFTAIAILPLIIMRLTIHRGRTVVDIQKWRTKNKNFLKVMTGVGFMVLGILILVFEIIGE